MLRIQLVIEDYGELMALQTVLKKMGFDVDATQNTIGLGDQLVALNPELVIMTAFGRKVSGLDFVGQMRRVREHPRVILIHGVTEAAVAGAPVTWITGPVDATELIAAISRLFNLNQNILLEKHRRQLGVEGGVNEASRLRASSLTDQERRLRHQKFLEVAPPRDHAFTTDVVREQVKALRRTEAADSDVDLERERREFVAQLFKKKG